MEYFGLDQNNTQMYEQGTSDVRGTGSMRVTEYISKTVPPAIYARSRGRESHIFTGLG